RLEVLPGLVQAHDERVRVRCLDRLDLGRVLRRVDRAFPRTGEELEREEDVLGSEVGAVVELDALAQMERVSTPVLAYVPTLREAADELSSRQVLGQQPFLNLRDHHDPLELGVHAAVQSEGFERMRDVKYAPADWLPVL